jgi:hypothetical protein
VEAVPAQSAESEVSVPAWPAVSDSADGASDLERNGVRTPIIASSPPSTSIPSPNPPSARGARQAGTASAFRSSRAPETVRPPMLLDTAICVLLVLVFTLLCRRVF